MASHWEGVRFPRASRKSPDFPGTSPNFPGSFSATSPEVLSLWNLTTIQRFPGSFPDFPGSSPNFPGGFQDFPGGQPLFLGSLTPSLDSQELPLKLRANLILNRSRFLGRGCDEALCSEQKVGGVPTTPDPKIWKATKECLNQRGTKIRVFRVLFRAPFLPPFSPHFAPSFPLQALCILPPLLPSSPPPLPPFLTPGKLRFRYPSDLGTL